MLDGPYNEMVYHKGDILLNSQCTIYNTDPKLKATSVSENEPIRKNFYRTVSCDDILKFDEKLHFSDSSTAPTRLTNSK